MERKFAGNSEVCMEIHSLHSALYMKCVSALYIEGHLKGNAIFHIAAAFVIIFHFWKKKKK